MRIVRALQYTTVNSGRDMCFVARLLYEFLGYVISAPATTPTPGGVPAFAFNTFPANALEGTTVLNTGTDGVTTVDTDFFDSASASFATTALNKYLVVWDSATPGQEDGIYKVTERLTANRLRLYVPNGGSPHPTTKRPRLTSRSGLKYRLIDLDNVGGLAGWATGQYIVMQLTPSISNPGQANSQFQLNITSTASGLTAGNVVGSPAGTWNGSLFTDPMTAVSTTSNSGGFFNGSAVNALGQMTMFGDKDGVILWFKHTASAFASYIHVEAPIRTGTQVQDPNPLLIGCEGVCTLFLSSHSNGYTNFWMAGTDGVGRRHRMLVKCYSGDGNGELSRPTATAGIYGDSRIAKNHILNRALMSKVVIGQCGAPQSQFSLARATMRYARIISNLLPPWVMVGASNDWLHVQNGICFPWDGTILGTNLVPFGY
jgi:hypothetical protein